MSDSVPSYTTVPREESPDTLVKDLVAELGSLNLREDPIATYATLPEATQALFIASGPYGIPCWNALTDGQIKLLNFLAANSGDEALLKEQIATLVKAYKTACTGARDNFKANYQHLVSTQPGQSLDMIKKFLALQKFINGAKYGPGRAARKSSDALSNRDDVSGAKLSTPITGDMVHHNMFNTESVDGQDFIRFDMRALLRQNREVFLEEHLGPNYTSAIESFTSIQELFLTLDPYAGEDTTQAYFMLFMCELLPLFNDAKGTSLAVKPVTGMTPVTVEVAIAESYMQQHETVRAEYNKSRTTGYVDGDWETQLSLRSDVVVAESFPTEAGNSAGDQLKCFLYSNLIIEMKRFRSLVSRENKSQLTQVSAESYARNRYLSEQKKGRAVYYSLLTDLSVVYIVCHKVYNDGPDQYWVSRSEDDPFSVVAAIVWVLTKSFENGAPNLSRWKCEGGADKGKSGETGGGQPDKPTDGDMSGSGGKEPKGGGGKPPISPHAPTKTSCLKMEDLMRGEDIFLEGPGNIDWSHFYALLQQQQSGQRMVFTGLPDALAK